MARYLNRTEKEQITEMARAWDIPLTTPVDRENQEAAIRQLYLLAGYPAPKQFYWANDPDEYSLVNAELEKAHTETQYDVVPDPRRETGVPHWFEYRALLPNLPGRLGVSHTLFGSIIDGRDNRMYYSYAWADGESAVDHSGISTPNVRGATGGDNEPTGGVFGRKSIATFTALRMIIRQRGLRLPPIPNMALNMFQHTVRAGGTWTPYEGGVVVCENPTSLVVNNNGQVHNLEGPAVTYANGWKRYYINGVRVPEALIEDPTTLTLEQITGERNTEIRRIMIERLGIPKFLELAEAELVDDDPVHGKLWKTEALRDDTYFSRPTAKNGYSSGLVVRPATYLEVTNPTPEPDGTYRKFFLRVPARYRTAHGARASGWNMKKHEFKLAVAT
jgi:hypothetical protein